MIDADIQSVVSPLLAGGLWRMEAKAGVAKPYGVYTMEDAVPVSDLRGEAALTNHEVMIEIYADDPGTAQTAALAVRAGMASAGAFKSICRGYRDIFDFELTLPGVRNLFSVWQ